MAASAAASEASSLWLISCPFRCSIGSFQGLPGQTRCDNATAGFYSDTQGRKDQLACAIGSYSTDIGSAGCSPCDTGDVCLLAF